MLDLIRNVGGLVNLLIAIVIALAVLAFFWGLAKFIFKVGGDENAVEEGKRIMLWGVIALFVMVSVWGIVQFLQESLGLNSFLPSKSTDGQVQDEEPESLRSGSYIYFD